MIRPLRVAVLSLCCAAAAACGFDSNGLATGSNSAGTLESTGGGESSEGDDNSTTSPPTTTSASGPSTMSSTTAGDDSTTMPPGTTAPSDTSSAESDTTAASTTAGTTGGESSEGGGESSSSTGEIEIPSVYYADCTFENQGEACGPDPSYCQAFLLDDDSTGHVCYVDCDLDGCPTPATGNVEGSCNGMGFCVLDCEGGLTCPDGMICDFSMSFNGYRCVWPA
jgi:hypothetical protein